MIRGNLLVIPVGDSLLYVEPLYLQAATGKIPELQRVIVATADQVVMAESLGLALAELFGADVIAEAGLEELLATGTVLPAELGGDVTAVGADGLAGVTVEDLVLLASEQYVQAQESFREGDWANYGLQMNALQATLNQLVEVTGVELPPLLAPETDVDGEALPDAESEAEPVTDNR